MPHPELNALDRLAGRYDRYAALETETLERLLERLAFRQTEPARIVDLGGGTGAGAAALKRQFRKAEVICLDLSPALLAGARGRSQWLRPLAPVCADFNALPFAARSCDLVFSNLAFQWCRDPARLFAEIRRVLRPDGLLLFSTLGAASLPELHKAGAKAGAPFAMPAFADLLEIGDALMTAGFREPVMDSDRITLTYPSLDALEQELEGNGTTLLIGNWAERPTGSAAVEAWNDLTREGRYPLGYEIVYGTAYGPAEGQPRRTERGEEAAFSVEALLKTRPEK